MWRKILKLTFMNPISRLGWLRYQLSRNNDYFLITMPASGTHWLRFMLAKALVDHYDLSYEFRSIRPTEIVPHFGNSGERFKYNQREEIPRVQQCHLPYFFWFRNKKVILLIRDLRDSLSSHYEDYVQTKRNDVVDFSTFLRNEEIGTEYGLEKKVEFLNSWYHNKDKTESFLLLKYEDLKKDTQAELYKALNFIDLENISDNFLEKVVSFSSLQNMKQIEKEEKRKGPKKIKKGQTKRFSPYFNDKDLSYFNQYVSEHLDNCHGYDYEQKTKK